MIVHRPLRVYVSSMYRRREEMLAVTECLRGMGHVVTSRWITNEEDCYDSPDAPKWVAEDVADVLAADVLLFFSESSETPGAARGGRHVEFGIALGAMKSIYIIGGIEENLFHRHPSVARVETLNELIILLKVLEPRAVVEVLHDPKNN